MKSQMSLAVPSSRYMGHKVSRWQSWQYPTTFPRSRISVNNVICMRTVPKKAAINYDYDLGSPAVPQI
ncbi:Hypothetical predicted protein [Drosophila guanche]|uniref:Uncharacterized protein n=1 Tax=Drosophila guanche TaxID=7266 RepID=A0A3B0J567_DROGU|nr:Hypothetical predicted protein [Drosophila guanche]